MLRVFLNTYADLKFGWKEASEDTAKRWGASSLRRSQWKSGGYAARQLRHWARLFIEDHDNIPFNLYGTWNTSLLEEGDLAREIHEHLQSLGPYVRAQDVVEFVNEPRIQQRYRLSSSICLRTAQRWMHLMDYRWTKTPKGQYVDGHERVDVVGYRQSHYLPRLAELSVNVRSWNDGIREARGEPPAPYTVIWYHDESTFYANDRRIIRWVHKDEKAVPRAKGEGASLMVADFISADYGWLRSRDGSDSARVFFRAGQNREGYFTNEDIVAQAEKAMDILERDYPGERHVFVYDNATTHTKRADDALSARYMQRNPSNNFWVTRNVRNTEGKLQYDKTTRKRVKECIPMTGAYFNNDPRRPQSLYYPRDHPDANLRGKFKGMEELLRERGINTAGLLAECRGFKCPPGRTNCCMRRILFCQPDFCAVESVLESHCSRRGISIILLPKFHPELNPIEQCWGHAKRRYRELPKSSKEDDLERNVRDMLDTIPLECIRKFCTRSARFADAYRHGLNGEQAAWAAKKYRGHRVLPNKFMDYMPPKLKRKAPAVVLS
ncbi:hypothetical protein PENSPDRAFT_678122 [Peniophora sp. CONT]|nr:hypothetical protein PENSPDRAFT_678122 [Peniophora sp. CONT]